MAHQFPLSSGFHAGYPPLPFYPPFTQSSSQTFPNGQLGYHQPGIPQQNTPIPSPQPANARHDSNSHAVPQSAPPFLPNKNPEMFRHFPPPPLPSANFPMGPGTPTSFTNVSQALNHTSQPYPPSQSRSHLPENIASGIYPNLQSSTPVATSYSQNQGAIQQKTMLQARYAQPTTQSSSREYFADASYSIGNWRDTSRDSMSRSMAVRVSFLTSAAQADSSSQQTLPRSDPANRHSTNVIPVANAHLDLAQVPSKSFNPLSVESSAASKMPESASQLKEHAKAAMLSLVPLKVTYNDMLDEGIDSTVLQRLFDELGLNWRQSASKAEAGSATRLAATDDTASAGVQTKKLNESPLQQHNQVNKPAVSSANTAPEQASTTQQTPAAKAIERKDRIAQLLAAKSAKTGTQAPISQSISPVSFSESLPSQLVRSGKVTPSQGASDSLSTPVGPPTMPLVQNTVTNARQQTVTNGTSMSKINTDGLPILITIGQPTNQLVQATRDQLAALPTPVRQNIAKETMSSMIPGLFMAADEESDKEDVTMADSFEEPQRITRADDRGASPQTISSQKRSAVNSVDFRSPKRAASSEGEISEHESVGSGVSDGGAISDSRADAAAPVSRTSLQNEQHNTAKGSINSAPSPAQNSGISSHVQSATKSLSIEVGGSSSPAHLSAGKQQPVRAGGQVTSDARTASSPVTPQRLASASATSGILSKSTPEDFAERAARLKADIIMRQRALRQKQLVDGLPILNDEVSRVKQQIEQYRSRLAETQLEVEKCQAQLSSARTNETQLLEEISRLEQQLQAGISGQKELSKELSAINQQVAQATSTTMSSPTVRQDQQTFVPPTPINTAEPSATLTALEHGRQVTDGTTSEQREVDASFDSNVQSRQESVNGNADISAAQSIDEANQVARVKFPLPEGQEVLMADTNVTNDTAQSELDDAKLKAVREGRTMDESISNDEESMQQSEDDSYDTHMSVDESSEGSVSMSDSGSEDYEPPEPKGQPDSSQQTEDSEEYEPEEIMLNDVPKQVSDISPVSSSSADPHATESTEHGNSTLTRAASAIHSNTPQLRAPPASTISQDPHASTDEADDRESALQLSEAETLIKPQVTFTEMTDRDDHVLSGGPNRSSTMFTPYQSPLSSFKSYRFHPSFNDQVKNGYRSLTYSNRIDPKQPLCPTELAGEACTNPTCEEQHFGSMNLTDDKILVQMSSANDIKNKASRDQYLLGLKQIIAQLRQEGVKEFPLVADALSKYRREWAASQMDV